MMNNLAPGLQPFRRHTIVVLLIVFVFGTSLSVAHAAGQSVEDFLKTKPRWSKLVGTTFRIEGRLATGAGTTLKLNKLPILFVSDEELPELRGPDLAVEVVGRLKKKRDTGVFEFELLSLRKTESDLERVNRLRVDLPRSDPEPWYELGDWVMNRVRFYRSGRKLDQQLTGEATELYRMALRKERTRMSVPTYRLLRELALKSERYGLGGEFKLPLLYEAYYRTWNDVRRKGSAKELANVAVRIARELPDANQPVPEFDADIVDEWSKGPVGYYQRSSVELRPQLHRLLYQQVMLQSIETDAVSDGRNGDEIAARLKEFIPEFSRLAEKYRARSLQWRVDNVQALTREEALALKQELIDAGDAAGADKAFREWFKHIESQLRRKGAGGLVQLASEYESLFDDGRTATQLLLEADRAKPGSSYVEERLEAYGYTRAGGRWRLKSEIIHGDLSPIDKAIRDGRVIRGMTSAHVRKAMGRPDSVSRVLTSREVLEYWVYRVPSGSGLSVRMSRPVNRHEGIVRKIFDLPAR
jgi:hypothetical protein